MADNNWASHWDLDEEFDKKYHRRGAEKCCAHCLYGEPDFEGEARCSHPKRGYKPAEEVRLNTMCDNVCDLWEPKRETDTL